MAKKKTGVASMETVPLTVSGPEKGFWRAGMQFGREARDVDVTLDVASVLMAEAELNVKASSEVEAAVAAWRADQEEPDA